MKKRGNKTRPNEPRPRIKATKTPSKRWRRLSELFPDLANYTANDLQTGQDLLLTEAEFGARYRKGKANRLRELETKNTQVAYETLKIEHSRIGVLGSELDAALKDNNGHLHNLLSVPKTPAQATALLRLWFLNLGPKGPRIHVTLDDLRSTLQKLKFDNIDTEIARRLIYPIGEPETVQDFARRVRLTRQSIYPRIRKITQQIDELNSDRTFAPLIEAVSEARTASSTGLHFPVQHPLISIAVLSPSGMIGHIADLLRIALLCAARRSLEASSDPQRTRRIRLVEQGPSQAIEII
jgi:hypothetical protein